MYVRRGTGSLNERQQEAGDSLVEQLVEQGRAETGDGILFEEKVRLRLIYEEGEKENFKKKKRKWRGKKKRITYPSLSSVPPGPRHVRRGETRVDVPPSTTLAPAVDDIGQGVGVRVQPGVEEAEGAEAPAQAGVVEERDDGGEGRGAGRGAADADGGALADDDEARALRRHVREAAASRVVQALEGAADAAHVSRHGLLLVRGPRPDVGEPARAEVDGVLGLDAHRAADRGHVRAGGWEDGQEARRVLAVVGLAGAAWAGAIYVWEG